MSFTRAAGILGAALAVLAACSKSGTTGPDTPGGGVNVALTPCGGAYTPIIKVAMQDGTGPWKVVNASGGTYTANYQQAKGGLLLVFGSSGTYSVNVIYGLPDELVNYVTSNCEQPIGTANVTVNSLLAGETATVGLGWNGTSATGPGTKSFTVPAISAVADLLGVLSTAANPAAKFILRRNVSAGAIAALDFTTAEAFTPTAPALAITGTGTDAVTFAEWYTTAAGFRLPVSYGSSSTVLPTTYAGMPAAKQVAGDLHELFAYTATVTTGAVNSYRGLDYYWHDPADRTLAFQAMPAAPTFSFPATAPYVRMRTLFTMPAGVNGYIYNSYHAGTSTAYVYASAGYLGTTATDLAFPDLTSLAGWDNGWMPHTGSAGTWGFTLYRLAAGMPVFSYLGEGKGYQYDYWYGTATP